MTDADTAGAMSFLFEVGMLKRAKRTGWWIAGINNPESIADHSFRAAITGTILAAMEGVDPARVALMCVLHDTQETRIGDISRIGKRYLKAADNPSITADQIAGCPPTVVDTITSAVAEYEAATTPEAIVARDADKLECLIQAVEYQHQGITTVQSWIDNCRAALKTDSALRLADAAIGGEPLTWLSNSPKPRQD
ncbi:HD domain-containing protein [Dactylosporangium fulvum]